MSTPLNRACEWRIFVQRSVRSDFVVIARIGLQHPAQVRLAKYDHVVDAFTTDRPDQSFSECVLPRRAWGNRLVADAPASNRRRDSEMSVTIRLPIRFLGSGRSSARDETTPRRGRVHDPCIYEKVSVAAQARFFVCLLRDPLALKAVLPFNAVVVGGGKVAQSVGKVAVAE